MTLTERVTRFELIIKIPNYHAQTCLDELQAVINERGTSQFKSITFDNGSEFSLLDQVKGTQIYFAHPYSSWERGSNENANGQIREYIPKGESLKNYTENQIQQIQDALNNRIRKSIHYLSAEAYYQQLTAA